MQNHTGRVGRCKYKMLKGRELVYITYVTFCSSELISVLLIKNKGNRAAEMAQGVKALHLILQTFNPTK